MPFFFCILSIFIVNLFLHLYKLGDIPFAIHIDEAGLWYNIQSLLNYGTDQSGNSWPLLFANYHSEQSAMYTYVAMILFKIFGESLFILRLPAVLNAAIIFIFGNKIVWKLYNNKYISISFSVLVTLCPYFILSGRMALDCNLMLGLITMFLWFFLQAIENKKITYAVIAGVICGLTLYTYALSYISLPFFLVISLIYLSITKKITWKQALAFSLPLVLFAIPLTLIQMINVFNLQELNIGIITLPKFNNPRHDDLSILSILSNFAMPLLYILFTPQRLYECVATYGNFQWVLMPFLMVGIILNIVALFRRNTPMCKMVLTLWWISGYFAGLLIYKDLTTWHLNSVMIISLIFIVDGLMFCFNKIKEKSTKIFLSSIIILVFSISSCSFLCYYWSNYATDEANSYYVYEDLNATLGEVDKLRQNNQDVYILLPSMPYRICQKIPYFQPTSSYTNSKEDVVYIDGYYFDMGAKVLQTPCDQHIYVVHQCYEDYLRILNELNLHKQQVGTYVIFSKKE